jgi:hypothetical protein
MPSKAAAKGSAPDAEGLEMLVMGFSLRLMTLENYTLSVRFEPFDCPQGGRSGQAKVEKHWRTVSRLRSTRPGQVEIIKR